MRLPLVLIAALAAAPAAADLTVSFIEGAPKDRFRLTNSGGCALPALDVTLDLRTAAGGLIFDTTAAGAGVEVFQPFEWIAGADLVTQTPRPRDGDSVVTLRLRGIASGDYLAFSTDIDDTGGGREITVSGAEIAGAEVIVSLGGTRTTAVFDDTARAVVPLDACQS